MRFLLVLLFTLPALACSNSSVPDDNNDPLCDTSDVTWPEVRVILEDNCWGCHSNAVAGAGIRALEDYEDVVEEVRDGALIPSIERSPDAQAMPPFNELDTCSIAIIRAWRDQGFRQ